MLRPHRSLILRLLATCALLVLLAAGVVYGAAGERIETVAGSGSGFAGDGGAATGALLASPSDIAPLDPISGGGGYLIADTANHRIRRVDAGGAIQTVAGAGPAIGAPGAFGGDGLAPTDPAVRLNQPRGVSAFGATIGGGGSGFLIADTGNNRIRRVQNGVIATVAGSGQPGFGGDGDGAQNAQLNQPAGVAALPDGGYLIADTGNNRIRRVSPSGIVTTVAGAGPAAFTGDGGPATSAALNAPSDVAPLTGGGFLIADTGNNRIRRVTAGGTIATVVGSGLRGFGGDGGPAGKALLNGPEGVAALADGSIAIADSTGERVRLVGVDGTIRTLAGTGVAGFSGDGGDPELAQLSHPRAVAQDGARLLVADTLNDRIRSVAQAPVPPDDSLNPTPPLGVSPPVLGKSVVAKPRLGKVLVRLAGTSRFVPLESIANLPMGSELDVADGSVVVFFATSPTGKRAKGIATGGRFVVDQPPAYEDGQRPGELSLSGPLLGCAASPRTQVRGQAASAVTPLARASATAKHGRRLKVRARGRIRTRGRYGAATVRGTRWSTIDRCDSHPRPGTLVVVSKGLVAVRSFALQRTVLVPAGKRFLAPARRP
jgi:NHL repeat